MSSTLYVLYGSATGNAEQIAKDLSTRALPESSPFTKVECEPLENYRKFSNQWLKKPADSLVKHGVIIVTSTTGNGEPPENAVKFVRYVKRKPSIKLQPFRNVAYSVLGLGDTNYSQFCETAKVIDSKLIDLGGIRVQSLDCADEGTGLEDVVEPYLDNIHEAMKIICTGGKIGTAAEKKADNGEEKQSDPADATHVTKTAEEKLESSTTIPEAPKKSDSPLFVLYGSATGNAEQIAKDLATSYEKRLTDNADNCYFPSVVCCELDQYKKKCLPTWEKALPDGCKHALLMVASTTGNGDPPENASRFVRYIKRNNTASDMPLKNVAYAVLALGDTNYDQFCETGRTLDRKVAEIGGIRAVPLKCADEATGLEDAVNPWTAAIIEKITIACRGNGLLPVSVSVVDTIAMKNGRDEEEKKADEDNNTSMDTEISAVSKSDEKKSVVQSTKPYTLSQGSNVARSLLELHDHSAPLIEVDDKVLPSIGSSSVSCRLLNHEEGEKFAAELENNDAKGEFDRMTISTTSSNAVHYTFKKPFHSSIVKARYLTATSTKASEDICKGINEEEKKSEEESWSKAGCEKAILLGRETIDNRFPIVIDNETDKQQAEKNMKRVIEMALSLPDDFTLEYNPGDSVGLVVENTTDTVQFVLNMLQIQHGLHPNQNILLEESSIVKVEDVIRSHIDLSSPIKNKRIIHSMSEVATNKEEKHFLRLLASRTPEGEKLFRQYVDEQRISVADLLREFPSTQVITLGELLTILPGGIAPRYYSVCSSPLDDNKSLKVAFSVVDYITPSLKISVGDKQVECGMRRIGGIATRYLEILCSSHMSSSSDNAQSSSSWSTPKVKIFPKATSDFHLPQSMDTPLILVGPGTGIAPFIGFLSHRQAQLTSCSEFRKQTASTVVEGTWRGDYDFGAEHDTDIPVSNGDAQGLILGNDYQQSNNNKNSDMKDNLGTIDVFFGCRHENHDYLYRNDMKEFMNQAVLTDLHTAFSRDKIDEQTKYVQDLMRNNADCRARMIELIVQKKASIYICGDGNAMAKDVQETLITILEGHVETSAKEYVEGMKSANRLLLDIWTS